MLQRIGFGRYEIVRPARAPLRPPSRWIVPVPVADIVLVRPKAVKARPGKRAPTVAESAWMDACVAHGCIACLLDGLPSRPACIHHILQGGVRMGHLYTLPLCDPGHHQGGQSIGLISRHPWKARFEDKYGPELKLLEIMKARLSCARV